MYIFICRSIEVWAHGLSFLKGCSCNSIVNTSLRLNNFGTFEIMSLCCAEEPTTFYRLPFGVIIPIEIIRHYSNIDFFFCFRNYWIFHDLKFHFGPSNYLIFHDLKFHFGQNVFTPKVTLNYFYEQYTFIWFWNQNCSNCSFFVISGCNPAEITEYFTTLNFTLAHQIT